MIIRNSHGLSVEFLESASIKSIEAGPIRINLKAGTSYQMPGTNIYLRKREKPFQFIGLLEPGTAMKFRISEDQFFIKGTWEGIDYQCKMQLSSHSLSWQFDVEMLNKTGKDVDLDLIYVQDVGLKAVNAGLINEYYVSQYLERSILTDEKLGAVICCRQNNRESTGNPWLMIAAGNGATDATTDGMKFYGKSFRQTGIPEGLLLDHLPGGYAGESSVVALREKPFTLAAGQSHTSRFMGHYLPDHPLATSDDDLALLPQVFSEFQENKLPAPDSRLHAPVNNLFRTSAFFPSDDLTDGEVSEFFGSKIRNPEFENGRLLSFFKDESDHVVLKSKELLVDRPHGHIMQARAGFTPNENIVSTTAFMSGVFNSHLTQGNTNFNTLLSILTSQFSLSPESGQRIFAEIENRHYLLGVPSAFEMGLNHCRWIYKMKDRILQVRTWTSKKSPQVNLDFKVIKGDAVNLIITHQFDELNGWKVKAGTHNGEFIALPKPGSMISGKFAEAQIRFFINSYNANYQPFGNELLFDDQVERADYLFAVKIEKTQGFSMSILGEVDQKREPILMDNPDRDWQSDTQDARAAWRDMSMNLRLESNKEDIRAIREILPWYGMNAITHFLTPYGLEQFGGAAWGTRDVSQGPIELLLSLGKHEEARKVLCIIFSNQHSHGGWSQWWMFDRYAEIRAHDSHGDVVYWCIIALSNYIRVTGDLSILSEPLPYFDNPQKTPVSEHMQRLIRMITGSFIPGTALVPFGGGDWNDSLQPVSRELAERLISSWTVEMNYQAFKSYQDACELAGNLELAEEMANLSERIKADFNQYLIKDGVVAGYGLVEKDGRISVLLHPSDTMTRIKYSVLPMERGILSKIFTKEQADLHQKLIEDHLKGPDGARLMDRPLKYRGGIQTIFQRAESSTFFGREIGLMYIHEHIRYAESLAATGKADAFVKALRQAIPVAYRDLVPCGDIRQANCYYSSSDVAFKSRYEADERYDEIKTGNIMLRGGWRVYSSGPGIYINLIITKLLGLRVEAARITLDPVLPESLDGLSASMILAGLPVRFIYHVEDECFSPKKILINGKAMDFKVEDNKYRKGGAAVEKNLFLAELCKQENTIEIFL